MSQILLVDGNPDHVKSLTGLFKYRIKKELLVVSDCVAGLRKIYADAPEVVLVNALLFASEDYGFARVLAEEPGSAGTTVIVLVSGKLGEIRERAMQQFGATVLELPTSADELQDAIQKATAIRSRTSGPRTVTWGRVDEVTINAKPKAKPEPEKQPTVQKVVWESIDTAAASAEEVTPVSWPVGSASEKKVKKTTARRTRSREASTKSGPSKRIKREDAEAFRPAFTSGGDGFKPLASKQKEAEAPEQKEEKKTFKASSLNKLSDVDPRRVKNK